MENRYGWDEDFCIVCGCQECDEKKCKDRIEDINPAMIRRNMEELLEELWSEG